MCITNDSYDFSTIGTALTTSNKKLGFTLQNGVFKGVKEGVYSIFVEIKGAIKEFVITVFKDATTLGEKFPLDKGMFKGKKVVAFGDSITDGFLLDKRNIGGFNYTETYFAKLCYLLETKSDPTDLRRVNFAKGGTCLTYGRRRQNGLSGVERIARKKAYIDVNLRKQFPRKEVEKADLCIIYYGSNDMALNVQLSSSNDKPDKVEEALTIKGATYYLLKTIRELNSNIKILLLPPIYRRQNPNIRYTDESKNDVYDITTGHKLSDFGKVMGEVCKDFGAKFFNWYNVFNYENFGKEEELPFTKDGLHPSVLGHQKMFDFIIDAEKELQEGLQK